MAIQATHRDLGVANDSDTAAKPDLVRLERMFMESQTVTSDARTESLNDTDYYDGAQWSPNELAALARRKQPSTVINRVKPAVNGIIGVIERGRTQPKCWPRTEGDADSADAATDALGYVIDFNRFKATKRDCFKDMLVPGIMAAQIVVDDDREVVIEQIRFEDFFYDPYSRRADFRDARYMGVAKWMYGDDIGDLYPTYRSQIDGVIDGGGGSAGMFNFNATYADRPNATAGAPAWVDAKRRRLQCVEMYYREAGKWHRSVFVRGLVLEGGVSPWIDAKGRPMCGIEAQAAYVDKDNARYGAVRDMRGPQDEINKRRSKLLHLLSVSQVQATDMMAIDADVDRVREEAAKPDGVIPPGWEKVSTTEMTVGQVQLLAEAKTEMDRQAPNPAMMGRGTQDASGRALMARQQAGLIELSLLFGELEDWELRVYRQCWARIRQFWNAAKIIRITDDEESPKFVGLNVPRGQPLPVTGPDGQPQIGPDGQPVMTEGPPMMFPARTAFGNPHPAAGRSVFGYKNVVAEMDVDITIDTQPDMANVQAEQFQDIIQLLGSNPQYAAEVPFEVVLGLSAVPHKRQLITKLKGIKDAQQQAQAAMAAKVQAAAEATATAGIRKTESETALNTARAESTLAGGHMDAFKAGAAVTQQGHDMALARASQANATQPVGKLPPANQSEAPPPNAVPPGQSPLPIGQGSPDLAAGGPQIEGQGA